MYEWKKEEHENKENNIKKITLKRLRGDGGFSKKWSEGTESEFRGVSRAASRKKVKKLVFLNKESR